MSSSVNSTSDEHEADRPQPDKDGKYPVKWYRSTMFNATILGLCNFSAPGIWGAMNSLGAGGAESPGLVNAADALTFCLMVLTCYFSSVIVRYIGIKGALIVGTVGYAPFAAGLYTNDRFGTVWLVLVGAAACGLSAGVFWTAEAAIAIAYPEPYNRGKVLGYWLTYRLAGQIMGGAINLGLNAKDDVAGAVSYKVYLLFIALQCLGPVIAWFLNKPEQVQRTDGRKVELAILGDPWLEIRKTTRLFFTRNFLLIVLFIGQAVYAEAVYNTYLDEWFSVRARSLGSFVGGIVAVSVGNVLGHYLDRNSVPLKTRSRYTFFAITTTQGAWWLWLTVNVTEYHKTQPVFDWVDKGFGNAFAPFVLLTAGFQLNYLYLYFIISNLAVDPKEVIRYAALLRGTESAWQAVSYGTESLTVFAKYGGPYVNFGLWGVSLAPAWLVIRHFGQDGAQVAADFGKEAGSVDQGSFVNDKLAPVGDDKVGEAHVAASEVN